MFKFTDLLDSSKVYYLASPYSSDNPDIVEERYEKVNLAGALLCKAGITVIEPIAMCHVKSSLHDLPSGYEYWKNRDRKFVSLSDGVIVLTLDGWKESIGVTDEIAYAKGLGKEVLYVSLGDLIEGNMASGDDLK